MEFGVPREDLAKRRVVFRHRSVVHESDRKRKALKTREETRLGPRVMRSEGKVSC